MMVRLVSTILVSLAFAFGCESTGADATPQADSAPENTPASRAEEKAKASSSHGSPTPVDSPGGGHAEVSKDGTKFDPPVEKARIPDGAWICDMGTVHYARMERGDGVCPLCKMDLKAHHPEAGAMQNGGHAH
jgi:hypothetical protein